jgi:hypothetical protein
MVDNNLAESGLQISSVSSVHKQKYLPNQIQPNDQTAIVNRCREFRAETRRVPLTWRLKALYSDRRSRRCCRSTSPTSSSGGETGSGSSPLPSGSASASDIAALLANLIAVTEQASNQIILTVKYSYKAD